MCWYKPNDKTMNNTKYPFTEVGLQQLLQSLNLLSPSDLQAQVNALSRDIKNWASAHFDFTAEQTDYLHNIDQQTLDFMAYSISFALSNHLPISLIKQEKKDKPIIKIIEVRNQIAVASTNDESAQASGGVIIKIHYA